MNVNLSIIKNMEENTIFFGFVKRISLLIKAKNHTNKRRNNSEIHLYKKLVNFENLGSLATVYSQNYNNERDC